MSKEYYLYVNGQRVKVSEQIYKVYWREKNTTIVLITDIRHSTWSDMKIIL